MALRSILRTCGQEALAGFRSSCKRGFRVVKVMQICVPGGGACAKWSFASQNLILCSRRRLGQIFASLLRQGPYLPRLLVYMCTKCFAKPYLKLSQVAAPAQDTIKCLSAHGHQLSIIAVFHQCWRNTEKQYMLIVLDMNMHIVIEQIIACACLRNTVENDGSASLTKHCK